MLITMQNIAKSFGAEVVLTDVNAVIQREDRIGMIGENGAGKTTLLKILCGEYQPDAGEVAFARGVTLGLVSHDLAGEPAIGPRTVLRIFRCAGIRAGGP